MFSMSFCAWVAFEVKTAKDVRDFRWYHHYRLGVFKELEIATEQGAAGAVRGSAFVWLWWWWAYCRNMAGEHQTRDQQ